LGIICIFIYIFPSTQALESLNKKDMTEIRSYAKPPGLVEKVMEAVMILRGVDPTWSESKKQLGMYLW
jgi:dynein heavy chain